MSVHSHKIFSEEYKYKQFLFWYNHGRPALKSFSGMMTPDDDGDMPKRDTIDSWMAKWKKDAEALDEQVKSELERRMVKEKVEMLSRHADLGRQMQIIGIDFLTDPENSDEITSATAVRLLISGVEIERESTGLPDALEKIMKQTDEELIERLTKITKEAPLEIEAIHD